MATENSPTAALEEVAHAQFMALMDAMALVKGAKELSADGKQDMAAVHRLIGLAEKELTDIVDALQPHV